MRGRRLHRLAAALGVAIGAHLLAWLGLCAWHLSWTASRVEPRRTDELPVVVETITPVELAPSALGEVPEIPLAALLGAANETGTAQTHPLPGAPVELPGVRAASAGGGAAAGETAFTERRDPSHDDALRHELWNGKQGYQSEHERTGKVALSPEAEHRGEHPGVGDRAAAARVASAGRATASRGDATAGAGAGIADPAPPRDEHDAAAGMTSPVAHPGAVQPVTTVAFVDPGAPLADVPRRGPTPSDPTNSAAASRELAPGAFEITPVAAGGAARTGVAGPLAPGQLANAPGTGTAATPALVAAGPRDLTVAAEPQDAYFRTLFARLDHSIVYPHELALDLRGGRPIAQFTLRADGTIVAITIAVPTTAPALDKELIRAITALKRLPPPPPRLLDGQSSIKVRVEWVFDPGILR